MPLWCSHSCRDSRDSRDYRRSRRRQSVTTLLTKVAIRLIVSRFSIVRLCAVVWPVKPRRLAASSHATSVKPLLPRKMVPVPRLKTRPLSRARVAAVASRRKSFSNNRVHSSEAAIMLAATCNTWMTISCKRSSNKCSRRTVVWCSSNRCPLAVHCPRTWCDLTRYKELTSSSQRATRTTTTSSPVLPSLAM